MINLTYVKGTSESKLNYYITLIVNNDLTLEELKCINKKLYRLVCRSPSLRFFKKNLINLVNDLIKGKSQSSDLEEV